MTETTIYYINLFPLKKYMIFNNRLFAINAYNFLNI